MNLWLFLFTLFSGVSIGVPWGERRAARRARIAAEERSARARNGLTQGQQL